METHSHYVAQNGLAIATVVVSSRGRITIHLSLNQNQKYPTTHALTIGQVEAAVQVLARAIADTSYRSYDDPGTRYTAGEGRARAHRTGSTIRLHVNHGSGAFLRLPLNISDAEGIFQCASAALRDALALMHKINGEDVR